MKRLLIDAVLIGNLGDDLFVKILLERYQNESFSIIIPKKYSLFLKQFHNIKIINFNKIRNLAEKISRRLLKQRIIFNKYQKKNDATVLVSGSAFIQQVNYESQVKIYKNDINKTNNYFMLGINFGPYTKLEFKNEFRNIFKECSDVCFREQFSYELFSELNNIRCAPDIVFTLNREKYTLTSDIKKVGISVIDLTDRNELMQYRDAYEEKIASVIIDFIDEGYEIDLYSFCQQQNDELCAERIIEKISNEKKNKINRKYYRGNIDYILNSIAQDEYMIATRFHAMILGWKFNKKVYPLIYSDKMKNVIDDLGFKGQYNFIHNIDYLSIETIKKNSYNLPTLKELEYKAEKQFSELDKFLSI